MTNPGRRRRIDEFALHEALDRIALAERIVAEMLSDHRGVEAVPAAAKKVERVLELLADAYQDVGRARVDDAVPTSAKLAKRGK